MHPSHTILEYWFGTVGLREAPLSDRPDWWWVEDPIVDDEIRKAFQTDVRAAADGHLADWTLAAESCLALLVLLDQFTRSIWRGSARAFEHDPAALAIAKTAIDCGHDVLAHPVKRVFFYIPFMHAESMREQDRSVELYTELRDTAPPHLRPSLDANLDFARKHRAVIERFGRFPSRNQTLGRKNTPEEFHFLAEFGPGW